MEIPRHFHAFPVVYRHILAWSAQVRNIRVFTENLWIWKKKDIISLQILLHASRRLADLNTEHLCMRSNFLRCIIQHFIKHYNKTTKAVHRIVHILLCVNLHCKQILVWMEWTAQHLLHISILKNQLQTIIVVCSLQIQYLLLNHANTEFFFPVSLSEQQSSTAFHPNGWAE